MRTLVVSEFVTLDGVMQAPGGKDEDTDGGFQHGGWTVPYWHDDIGASFDALMQHTDALLLGRRTYVTHAAAFEPMPPGDHFGDMMNAPRKYVVSRTLTKPTWRNTTIIRDDVIGAVRALKAEPGRNILTDGSSQLVHALLAHDLVDELHLLVYPLVLGAGKRVWPKEGPRAEFTLRVATPYPTGVVGLHYVRQRTSARAP
jgi:dihydrofolate reductase